MRLGFVVVLLAFAFSAPIGAPAWAGPHWGSDQVRAARPLAPVEALMFEVRVNASDASGTDETSAATASSVAAAPSFTFVSSGGLQILHDHTLCRSFHWDAGASAFGNHNCHAGPAFRLIEARNRQAIAEVLAGSGSVSPEAANPYWAEAELGVQGPTPTQLQRRKRGDGHEYRLGKTVVAMTAGAAGELSPDEMQRAIRALAHVVGLHPQIRRDLAAEERLPAEIIVLERSPARSVRRSIRIADLRREALAYPLPPGLRSEVADAPGKGPRDQALRRTLQRLENPSADPEPSLEALRRRMNAAGDPLEALLLFFALTQLHPDAFAKGPDSAPLLADVRAVLEKASQDPRADQFRRASELAGNPRAEGDREAAARFLASLTEADELPFGTFRYVTFANLVQMSPGAEKWGPEIHASMPERLADNFWIHIAANPWSANAFKDVGDLYFRGFETPDAWVAYDLGRETDPEWRASVLGAVEALETDIRSAAPDFF